MRRNRLLRGKRARLGSPSNRGWHEDGGSAGFGRRGFLSGPPPCVFVAAQTWASLGPGHPGFFFPPKLMGDSFVYRSGGPTLGSMVEENSGANLGWPNQGSRKQATSPSAVSKQHGRQTIWRRLSAGHGDEHEAQWFQHSMPHAEPCALPC